MSTAARVETDTARAVRLAGLHAGGLDAVEVNGEVITSLTLRAVPYREWANIGWFVETFEWGAFTASIARTPGIPLLLWHDSKSFPVGKSVAFDDNSAGLDIRFDIAMTAVAQEAGRSARDGWLTGCSVGFQPERSSWTYAKDWDPDKGPDYMDRVVRTQARLLEVSLTPTPAYVGAHVIKVDGEATREGVDTELRSWRGWADQARRHLQAG